MRIFHPHPNKRRKRPSGIPLIAAAVLVCGAVFLSLRSCEKPEPEPSPNPYEGMVQVSDGMGGLMWVPLYEEIPFCSLDREAFEEDGSYLAYAGNGYEAVRGIDVSHYQGEIDWHAVRADGVEFAMISCGYRGYSEGVLHEDPNFRQNISGALEAGVQVGIYFFSQATSVSEAKEEAEFVLNAIAGYNISYPVAFDWENIGEGNVARTDDVSGAELTLFCLAFCEKISDAGYEPCVYFYRRLGYYEYDLSKLAELPFWVGAPGNAPDFHYEHFMWQYSFTGSVSGIEGDVDLNLRFIKKAEPGLEADS